MSNYVLSIVIPTICDDVQFNNLINYANHIQRDDIEIIIVDQIKDRKLDFHDSTLNNTKIIYSDVLGLSQNRNIGIQYASGQWVMLLDDDAKILDVSVTTSLLRRSSADGIVAIVLNQNLTVASYSKNYIPGELNYRDALSLVNSNGLCLRRSIFKDLRFDETMGVGNFFGSCEEKLLVLDAIAKGFKIRVHNSHRVVHPAPITALLNSARSRSYGRGHGRLFRRKMKYVFVWRHYLPRVIAKFIVGSTLLLLNYKRGKAYLYWILGFFQGIIVVK